MTGKQAEEKLALVNITCNKNSIPNDTEKPMQSSGIRLGTAAMTSKGFKEEDFVLLAQIMDKVLKCQNKKDLKQYKRAIINMAHKYCK